MTDGFAARTCSIHIGRMIGIKDGKGGRWEAFWGDVHVFACQGGGGCEEDLLIECLANLVSQMHIQFTWVDKGLWTHSRKFSGIESKNCTIAKTRNVVHI